MKVLRSMWAIIASALAFLVAAVLLRKYKGMSAKVRTADVVADTVERVELVRDAEVAAIAAIDDEEQAIDEFSDQQRIDALNEAFK